VTQFQLSNNSSANTPPVTSLWETLPTTSFQTIELTSGSILLEDQATLPTGLPKNHYYLSKVFSFVSPGATTIVGKFSGIFRGKATSTGVYPYVVFKVLNANNSLAGVGWSGACAPLHNTYETRTIVGTIPSINVQNNGTYVIEIGYRLDRSNVTGVQTGYFQYGTKADWFEQSLIEGNIAEGNAWFRMPV